MKTTTPTTYPGERNLEQQNGMSPEYVRISTAAAIELGLRPGRMFRGCGCGCINLLQNYPAGCLADCTYCGLARERPGLAEENSFIRVSWPLYETDLVAAKIAEHEAKAGVGRVCIAQVQDHRAYHDLIDMTARIKRAAPAVPVSALVSATTLNERRLHAVRDAGADIIGVGLDAASEELFHETRGKGAKGPHTWEYHWKIIRAAREIFGPFKVNCHLIVGLGETDRDLVELFFQLREEEIAAYLFSFNPEPGTEMADVPRAPIRRLRRIQLVKHLIETEGVSRDAIELDDAGAIVGFAGDAEEAIASGAPFMTNGCPDREGKVACNRPYGSYRPGEEFRDYPFQPEEADLAVIRRQLAAEEICRCEEPSS